MLTLVLVAAIAVITAFDARIRSGPLSLHFATAANRFRIERRFRRHERPRGLGPLVAHMARPEHDDLPPARPIRNPFATTDALAKHRPVTGINAHIRWYERVRSLVGIVILVGVMGVLVAVGIGVAFFAARIVLEILVG